MARKISLTLIFLLLLAGICLAMIGKQIYPLTVKDEWGNKVKFTKAPERIISCMPNITEILYKLDLGDEIVGVTENCNYPPEAKGKEKVGRDTMNLEKIVSLKPDLIVMLGGAQAPDIKKFRSMGLPVFVIDPETVRGVMYSITLLGEATNRPHAAYSIDENMARKLDWVVARVRASGKKRPRVFMEVWHKPLITASKGTFLNDVIEKAGGVNIAANAQAKYPEYSFEKLISADPDVIIIPKQNISTTEQIYNDGKWKKLRAVQNKRVLLVDADVISRPGPRIVSAVDEIATFLYEWNKPANEK